MRTVVVHAERGLPGGTPETYRFGARVVRGAPREPLRIRQPGRVCGLAIAHDSEVRAVQVRVGGDWVPLVEGQPLAWPERMRGGMDGSHIEIDALPTHPHDGELRLQVAEREYEVPFLSRHVAPVTRLALRRFGRHVLDERHEDIHVAPPISPNGVRQYLALSSVGDLDAEMSFAVWGGVRGPGGGWRWRILGTFAASTLEAAPMIFAASVHDAEHAPWEAWRISAQDWRPELPEDTGLSLLVTCGWDAGDFAAPAPPPGD